jgi:hypothetical protein
LEELECAFDVVGKILMSRIKWNLFGKTWIQNVGDIEFEVISAAENSNKFQKARFQKEKSVEDVVTLGPMAQATLIENVIKEHMWRTCRKCGNNIGNIWRGI